jgi:hypothetical protein
MKIIVKNLIELRDVIITPENMLNLTYYKLIKNNDDALKFNLIDLVGFNINAQQTINHDDLDPTINDDIKLLGKTGEILLTNVNNGKTLYKENIYYNKYLKYKEKYLQLKKNT